MTGPVAGPVFVFSAHRSGGTMLARVLNCHPDLVIWGEHGGFINQLAEVDVITSGFEGLTVPVGDRGLSDFIGGEKFNPAMFNPWANPFEQGSYRTWCRRFIESTFSYGLRPGQRWGFKEIRYHTVRTASFLATLFPDARFVILRRALYPLALSNLFAPWSVDRLRWSGAIRSEADIRAAVIDCAYALTAIDHGFGAILAALPGRCHVVNHEAITPSAQDVFADLFMFLGLRGSRALLQAIIAVVESRVGTSDRGTAEGHLTLQTVERYLADALATAQAQIAADGIDTARLKRIAPQGRYSYLAGDHSLSDTPLSAMF
jgi:hypothetical protein